jgi:hypothetical protein
MDDLKPFAAIQRVRRPKLIADETEKWGKVVKFVGIKAD